MTTDDGLNPKDERCNRCGQVATGFARINTYRYCHGDGRECYQRQQSDDVREWARTKYRGALDLLADL